MCVLQNSSTVNCGANELLLKENMRILIALLWFFSASAYAGSIKQILNPQNLAVVEIKASENISIGDSFLANGEKDQCLLEVLKVDRPNVTVSTANCKDRVVLANGQKVEKSLIDPKLISKENTAPVAEAKEPTAAEPAIVVKPAASQSSNGNSYAAFIVGINVNNHLKIPVTATNSTTSEAGTFDFSYNNSVSLGFEWSQFDNHSWNNGILIDYSTMQFDTLTASGPSGTSSFSVPGNMSFLTVAYAGKYVWEDFYLPLGIGLTSSSVNDNTGVFTKSLKSVVTAWIGIGLSFSKNFKMELVSRAASVTSDTVTSSGTTFTPSIGTLSGALLTGKFCF